MRRYESTAIHTDVRFCLQVLCLGLFPVLIIGCNLDARKVSQQTDEKVYSIIDQKWDDSFGSQSDYKVKPFPPELSEPQQQEILTVSKALELAVTHSNEYQQAREQLYLSALDLTEARHLYELTPFAGGVGGYTKEGNREAVGLQGQMGIKKLLATGAAVSAGATVGSFDILSGNFRSGLVNIFQVAFTQPLLRGADRKAVLEQLTQAEQDTLYQVRTFNRFRQVFLVSVVTDYYRLLQQHELYQDSKTYYYRISALENKMKKLAKVGRLARYELEQVEQDRMAALDQYYQAKALYKEQLDAFKLKLKIPLDQTIRLDPDEWKQMVLPADLLGWSEEEAIKAALAERLDLANAYDQTLDAQRHVEVAAEGLKADLNLRGFYSPANDSRRRYTFGADPGDLSRARSRYAAVLEFNLPLDRTTEINNYKRVLLALTQQCRTHQTVTDQVVFEVRKAFRNLDTAWQQYDNQKHALELAQQRVDNTYLLLQYGRAGTRDLLDAQKDYFKAQYTYTQAMADYFVARLDICRDTGALWIKPNGLWESQITVNNNK